MACHPLVLTTLVLGSMVLSAPALARAQSPTITGIAPSDPAPHRTGGRVVTDAERAQWWLAILRAGLVPYLADITVGDRGFYGRAHSLVALMAFLDEHVFNGVQGVYRVVWFHRNHRDVGSRRLDYRTDRGVFGAGSMQVVVSRASGRVFIDMDAFSPYEDMTSFVGHSWEVVRNRFRRQVK